MVRAQIGFDPGRGETQHGGGKAELFVPTAAAGRASAGRPSGDHRARAGRYALIVDEGRDASHERVLVVPLSAWLPTDAFAQALHDENTSRAGSSFRTSTASSAAYRAGR
jgi:hypothetical protein